MRDCAELQPGESIVISGPGPIGLFVTNVAKMVGASPIIVPGTEEDTDVRLPAAKNMGADEGHVFNDSTLDKISDAPPAVWFETSGATPAVEAAVDHVQHSGRIICSGLGSGKAEIDTSRIAYENLQITDRLRGNEEYLDSAIDDVSSGELKISEVITNTFPMTEWRQGFEKARSKQGIKVLFDPSQ